MNAEAKDSNVDARRRSLLYAGVAATAAIAGAGFAVWRFSDIKGEGRGDAGELWAMNFETPAGQPMPMQAYRGKPMLLNFWATWCPPCVEEMPLLDAFYRQNTGRNWQVVGLAIDQPSAVRKFLEKTPVSYPIGLAGMGGTELSKLLGNETGGLPFTLVIAPDGVVLERKMGRLTAPDLTRLGQLA